MKLSVLFDKALSTAKSNSPEILVALGIGGVVATAVLSVKAGMKAKAHLESEPPYMTKKEIAKETWRYYIPPALAGATTIACIVGSSKLSAKRTAAAVAAYSVTERAFSEYKEKVIEQVGKTKELAVRDGIAQDKVNANPPSKEIVVLDKGEMICLEMHTGRYFKGNMQTLVKAQNEINFLLNEDVSDVTLDDFYRHIGLNETSHSAYMGWTKDKLLKLQITTALTEDDRPCLAFDYNYIKPLR